MTTTPSTVPDATPGTAPGTARHATVPTPLGPFTTLVDAQGAVLASGWTDDVALLVPLVHPALRPEGLVATDDLGEVGAAVAAFHDGDPGPAAATPVRQRGGAFLEQVWERMREIEAGAPLTYSELAERAGRPPAVRAAAAACARNAAALFVPCHRVLRRGGGLGGFRWGTPLKASLLDMERDAAAARAGGTVGPEEGAAPATEEAAGATGEAVPVGAPAS